MHHLCLDMLYEIAQFGHYLSKDNNAINETIGSVIKIIEHSLRT